MLIGCSLKLAGSSPITYLSTHPDLLQKDIQYSQNSQPLNDCTKLEILKVDQWSNVDFWQPFGTPGLVGALKVDNAYQLTVCVMLCLFKA